MTLRLIGEAGARVTARLEDGTVTMYNSGNVVFKDELNRVTHRLGRHDIIELARLACGEDWKLLEALARNMKHGHRFTDENGETDLRFHDDEEPF